jgi:hypothetical protein
MKFALRAPILKYTLFGMLFLNSPAQASEPRSERMEKTAAEVIAADSAAIPKGWDNDCRASYKAGYEAGYRAGYLHGRRTATQPHSSGRASATRYADGSIVPTRDTTASGRRFMHRIGAEFRPEYIFPTNPFVEGENRAGQPIDLSLSGHLRYSFQFRPGSIPDQIYGGAYQGITNSARAETPSASCLSTPGFSTVRSALLPISTIWSAMATLALPSYTPSSDTPARNL